MAKVAVGGDCWQCLAGCARYTLMRSRAYCGQPWTQSHKYRLVTNNPQANMLPPPLQVLQR